jgi:hypothetical protein
VTTARPRPPAASGVTPVGRPGVLDRRARNGDGERDRQKDSAQRIRRKSRRDQPADERKADGQHDLDQVAWSMSWMLERFRNASTAVVATTIRMRPAIDHARWPLSSISWRVTYRWPGRPPQRRHCE